MKRKKKKRRRKKRIMMAANSAVCGVSHSPLGESVGISFRPSFDRRQDERD